MYRPKEIAERLSVSPATLRHWSNEFADFLSPAAQKQITGQGTSAQRRYTDEDLTLFHQAKQFLGDGNTYEEVRRRLPEDPPDVTELSQNDEKPHDRGFPRKPPSPPLMTIPSSYHSGRCFAARTKPSSRSRLKSAIWSAALPCLILYHNLVVQPAPVRFRWDFLNRLLLDNKAHGDES